MINFNSPAFYLQSHLHKKKNEGHVNDNKGSFERTQENIEICVVIFGSQPRTNIQY